MRTTSVVIIVEIYSFYLCYRACLFGKVLWFTHAAHIIVGILHFGSLLYVVVSLWTEEVSIFWHLRRIEAFLVVMPQLRRHAYCSTFLGVEKIRWIYHFSRRVSHDWLCSRNLLLCPQVLVRSYLRNDSLWSAWNWFGSHLINCLRIV